MGACVRWKDLSYKSDDDSVADGPEQSPFFPLAAARQHHKRHNESGGAVSGGGQTIARVAAAAITAPAAEGDTAHAAPIESAAHPASAYQPQPQAGGSCDDHKAVTTGSTARTSAGAISAQGSLAGLDLQQRLYQWTNIAALPGLAALAASASGVAAFGPGTAHGCDLGSLHEQQVNGVDNNGRLPRSSIGGNANAAGSMQDDLGSALGTKITPPALDCIQDALEHLTLDTDSSTAHNSSQLSGAGASVSGPGLSLQEIASGAHENAAGHQHATSSSHSGGANATCAHLGHGSARSKILSTPKPPTEHIRAALAEPASSVAAVHSPLHSYQTEHLSPASRTAVTEAGLSSCKPATRANGTRRSGGSCQPVVGAQAGVTTGSWCSELQCAACSRERVC